MEIWKVYGRIAKNYGISETEGKFISIILNTVKIADTKTIAQEIVRQERITEKEMKIFRIWTAA